MSLKKFFTCLSVLLISVFSAFSLSAAELSSSEWEKAFNDIKCSTVKYSINGYLNKLNIGNISGSLMLANTKMFLNTNLSVSGSIDLILENVFGDTVSGEYNIYAEWQDGADELVLNELKYTTKNSKTYTSIKDNYLLKDFVNTFNNSLNSDDNSYAQLASAIRDKSSYEYKNGKYVGAFEFEKKSANSDEENGDEEDIDINFAITFNAKKQVSVVELEVLDSGFANPATGAVSALKIVLKGYVYNINKTTIVTDDI